MALRKSTAAAESSSSAAVMFRIPFFSSTICRSQIVA